MNPLEQDVQDFGVAMQEREGMQRLFDHFAKEEKRYEEAKLHLAQRLATSSLTVSELARLGGKHRQEIYRLIATGQTLGF